MVPEASCVTCGRTIIWLRNATQRKSKESLLEWNPWIPKRVQNLSHRDEFILFIVGEKYWFERRVSVERWCETLRVCAQQCAICGPDGRRRFKTPGASGVEKTRFRPNKKRNSPKNGCTLCQPPVIGQAQTNIQLIAWTYEWAGILCEYLRDFQTFLA